MMARTARTARWIMVALLTSVVTGARSEAQQRYPVDPAFEPKVDQLIGFLQSCDVGANEGTLTACNIFVAKALDVLYLVHDFGPDDAGKYLIAAVIRGAVRDNGHWTLIGTADQSDVLDAACTAVQDKTTPLIAISPAHVVILLPGQCPSTSWGANVPLVASYFQNHPMSDAFIGLPISKAWKTTDRAQVEIWQRNQ
jgi:hypothetical protein